MGAALWWGMGAPADWLQFPALERVVRLTIVVAIGLACYFGSLALLGFRVRDFRRKAAQ